MKGRVELVTSSNGGFQGGFVFGHPRWDKRNWFSFRVKRNNREGSAAYFGRHFNTSGAVFPALTVLDVNDLLVKVDDGILSAFVNGQASQQNLVPREGWEKGDRGVLVGLGGYQDENLWSLRFRNVQLRRLPK